MPPGYLSRPLHPQRPRQILVAFSLTFGGYPKLKIQLTVIPVVLAVTTVAALGMILGAAFGFAAGMLAPEFFAGLVFWAQPNPQRVAVVLGACGGVICGGMLGVFAIAIQALAERTKSGTESE